MTSNKNCFEQERFSIFPCGWKREDGTVKMQQRPQQTADIAWCYRWITSPLAASTATIGYRAMLPTATKDEKRDFKILNFQYATFAGIFSYRNAECKNLIRRSPYMPLDIDHLSSLNEARELQHRLCEDKKVETALCFVSPSGLGVKWIFELPESILNYAYKEQFDMMRDFLGFNYGVDADTSGSDVCRACFLGWDPECYINQKYIINNK